MKRLFGKAFEKLVVIHYELSYNTFDPGVLHHPTMVSQDPNTVAKDRINVHANASKGKDDIGKSVTMPLCPLSFRSCCSFWHLHSTERILFWFWFVIQGQEMWGIIWTLLEKGMKLQRTSWKSSWPAPKWCLLKIRMITTCKVWLEKLVEGTLGILLGDLYLPIIHNVHVTEPWKPEEICR